MSTTKSILYDIRLYVSDESKLELAYKRVLRFVCKNKNFFSLGDDEVAYVKYYINKFKKCIVPSCYTEILRDGRVTYFITFPINIRYSGNQLIIRLNWGDHIRKDLEFMYITYRRRGIIREGY